MSEIDRIIDELTRSLEGEPWHGPSILDVVAGLNAAAASAHPVAGAHSIWEIVHHVTAWVRAVHVRVTGKICELEGDTDWPPVRDASERAWTAAVADLRLAQSELISTLRTVRVTDLTTIAPNRDYDLEHLLRGLVQHHAYHTGQMALLARALQHGNASRGG